MTHNSLHLRVFPVAENDHCAVRGLLRNYLMYPLHERTRRVQQHGAFVCCGVLSFPADPVGAYHQGLPGGFLHACGYMNALFFKGSGNCLVMYQRPQGEYLAIVLRRLFGELQGAFNTEAEPGFFRDLNQHRACSPGGVLSHP